MIIDLKKFITEERPYWSELNSILEMLEKNPERRMDIDEVKRFHYLYQRTSADLAKIMTFSSEQKIRRYLESLVARAYGEIHETRRTSHRFAPIRWFFYTFPQTFRRHIRAFYLSLLIILAGAVFGGITVGLDSEAKSILLPFSHLQGGPSERVAQEEKMETDRLKGHKASFSSYLMTHNTKVSVFAMALGMTWGIGTIILVFYNGAILGAVAIDYIVAGETKFLTGWLLPHGSVEIPAILVGAQAGLILASALIGWNAKPMSLKTRFRKISGDLVTLIFGVGVMLIWAGFIESFFSQYHEPVIPYEVKIGFGMLELILLVLFFWKSGRNASK
jgi:uncharacterized membrane protein SpoIIM required for sporulation